jgi:drug/metabolite transporter (DMT)-like permease
MQVHAMFYLVLVSVIWGLSFSLVKGQLSGIDPAFISFARLLLALPLFLPFFAWRGLDRTVAARLVFIGAVQYGLMYICLFASFAYLAAFQVALFTVTTPLMVVLFAHGGNGRRLAWALVAVLPALAGAAIIQYKPGALALDSWKGFALLQASNACFAFGQVAYKRLRPAFSAHADRQVFALLYAGGVAITLPAVLWTGGFTSLGRLDSSAWLTLLYLGWIASGMSFFWWNRGAVLVHAKMLAVMNNVKVPLAVAFAFILLGERPDWGPLLIGSSLLVAALALASRRD